MIDYSFSHFSKDQHNSAVIASFNSNAVAFFLVLGCKLHAVASAKYFRMLLIALALN